jgi:PAS domain-containing protein
MTAPQIDYQLVFQEMPCPVMLLTPELVIADANLAYLQLADRKRGELLGRYVFDAFPDDPEESGATGASNVGASMRRVLATG